MARGDGRIYLRGTTYWLCYYLRGEQFRESAHTSDEKEAEKKLRARMRQVGCDIEGARPFQTPKANKLTVHDLLEALRADYVLRGKDSGQNLSHLKRADDDFGNHLAVALTSKQIDAYAKGRLAEGDKPASINRPLQLLRQAYGLAVKAGDLARAPYIRKLSEVGNARKGFVEDATFRAILEFLPTYLQDFCLFAFCTGMRFGEIRSLAWANIRGDVIELQGEDAKNGTARLVPMVGKDLAGIFARRKEAQKVKVGDGTTFARLIFHHNGKPIVDCRKAWRTACAKANVPGLLFHDLRRSAVRNLDRAGISRDIAMKISGHKTQSTYSRYNIVSTDDMRQALERTQTYREGSTGNVVVSISK
jgi:integrase